jgi:hypothetical protein
MQQISRVTRLLVEKHLPDWQFVYTRSTKKDLWDKQRCHCCVDQILSRPDVCRTNCFRSKGAEPPFSLSIDLDSIHLLSSQMARTNFWLVFKFPFHSRQNVMKLFTDVIYKCTFRVLHSRVGSWPCPQTIDFTVKAAKEKHFNTNIRKLRL